MSKRRRIFSWILQGLLAVAFVLIGSSKYSSEAWHQNFTRWGYPPAFLELVATAEVLLGLGILVPTTCRAAAAGIIVIMAGAAATHLRAGEPPLHLLGPLLYATLAVGVWILRKVQRRASEPEPEEFSPPSLDSPRG
ncbi:MAG: DoxX family protein [Candidatus Eisenbacteria bacterium]|uniref:DoxX family protein n=1 Tax=Eiseniibacteriota bacterium TaxID=2212470 RepID=A0A956RMZ4_UNCEI|nr:DoxX family protein [Candidatus Eisenbacteria bacterium]